MSDREFQAPLFSGDGFLAEPLYALKVVNSGGRAPIAAWFEYGQRLTSGRWYVARGQRRLRGSARFQPYRGPELCVTGWHVWPVRCRGAQWHVLASGWRALRNARVALGTREVWLVAVRGRYDADRHKLAADRIRFVRRLTSTEQHQLRYDAPATRLREVLGLGPGALLWLGDRPREGRQ